MTSHIATVLVLAAGQGKRMQSDLPKVVHEVCGRPMLLHVLDAARAVHPERIVVVLGHGYEKVLPFLPPDCVVALQDRQLGTGHAVLAAAAELLPGDMLVLPGDTPLVTDEALSALVRDHAQSGATATVLTMDLDDPTGYGRIVRGDDGSLLHIVEHRDATERSGPSSRSTAACMFCRPRSRSRCSGGSAPTTTSGRSTSPTSSPACGSGAAR